MKVLQIVKTNEGANWAFEQAKWLHENGVEVITVLPEVNGGMAEKYKNHGMKVNKGDFSLPISSPWIIFKRIKEINRIIDEVNPSIIHCHFVTNIMMIRIALRKVNIPRLFQVPGPLHLENKFFRTIEIILSNSNDYWAGACNKTCSYYLKTGIDNSRIFRAYYGGYGGNTCNEYKEASNILHNEFKLRSDEILIGMISYFYKPKLHMLQLRGLKGHEDFIDAIAKVRKLYPRIRGIIIGDAWGTSKKYVKRVKRYAKKKCGDGIIFTGFRNDIKKIYKELDVAVHPSHSENLGGAAESLAAGVPTVSTNVGGFVDIVINGKTGYTVNKKRPNELAAAIMKTIQYDDKSRVMAQNGQNYVRDLLDINTTSKKIFEIYNRILQQ